MKKALWILCIQLIINFKYTAAFLSATLQELSKKKKTKLGQLNKNDNK